MSDNIIFNGCKHLDFSDDYTAEKNLIQLGNTTKVCWNRKTIDPSLPSLVQFCKLRGRLNNLEACHCWEMRECSEYEDFEHSVKLDTINTE